MNQYEFPIKTDIEKGIISINSAVSSSSTLNTSYSSSDSSFLLEEISDVQPASHDSKQWCCEKIMKNIILSNYDLTKSEYKKYNLLRRECLLLYEETNANHEKLLKDLFDNFLEIAKEKISDLNSLSWKVLGFQGDNPRTDFRAGGFYSLKLMHYFIFKYSNDCYEMIRQEYFLFAVIAIRLTYLFKLFLNLVKDEELHNSLKSHKMTSCSRRQFKNFCIHLNYNENILLILLSKALIFTKNKFKEQFDKEKKELNFLLIDPILKRAIKCLGVILNIRTNSDDFDAMADKCFYEEALLP